MLLLAARTVCQARHHQLTNGAEELGGLVGESGVMTHCLFVGEALMLLRFKVAWMGYQCHELIDSPQERIIPAFAVASQLRCRYSPHLRRLRYLQCHS
jgi:hypothetical protein